MNSAIAIFFASLVSGVMGLAELRPTVADMVQILTGVELVTESTQETSRTVTVCSTSGKVEAQQLHANSTHRACKALHCKRTAYVQRDVYVL